MQSDPDSPSDTHPPTHIKEQWSGRRTRPERPKTRGVCCRRRLERAVGGTCSSSSSDHDEFRDRYEAAVVPTGYLELTMNEASPSSTEDDPPLAAEKASAAAALAGPLPPPRPPRPPRNGGGAHSKVEFLNGLRGLAALMVCHCHAGYFSDTAIAPTSVDMFFVLSAFLLTMLNEAKFRQLMDRKARPREWGIMLLDYSIKRVLRVYPLFACVIVVLTVLPEESRNRYYNLEHYHFKNWRIMDFLTFKYRPYLLWTLTIEMTYYLLIPFFVGAICLLGKLKWVAIVPLYVWVLHENKHTNRGGHGHFRPHLSTFVAGSLAAVVYSELSRWKKEQTFTPRNWQLAVVRSIEWLMVATVVSDLFRSMFVRWFHGSLFPALSAGAPAVALPVPIVIVVELLVPSSIARALEWNVLCYAGKVSFSMYLLHPFVVFQPWLLQMPQYDQFFVRILLFFLLATASYMLVEWPSQKLALAIGKWLAKYNGRV